MQSVDMVPREALTGDPTGCSFIIKLNLSENLTSDLKEARDYYLMVYYKNAHVLTLSRQNPQK